MIAVDLLIKFALDSENTLQQSIEKKVEKHTETNSTINMNQFQNATIEEKILILNSAGLSKEEIKNKLKNDTEFRELTKNGYENFETFLSKELKN